MKEMDDGQVKVARESSMEFERFWRIRYLSSLGRASIEDMLWAAMFAKKELADYKTMMKLETDQTERELLELVFLGLYHRGYRLPLELKYMRSKRN